MCNLKWYRQRMVGSEIGARHSECTLGVGLGAENFGEVWDRLHKWTSLFKQVA